jgi:hypothetical protein
LIKDNPHWGSSLDDFLNEEGILEAVQAEAKARVLAWQRKGMTGRSAARLRLGEFALGVARAWRDIISDQ